MSVGENVKSGILSSVSGIFVDKSKQKFLRKRIRRR
jgi:hypothetical protein